MLLLALLFQGTSDEQLKLSKSISEGLPSLTTWISQRVSSAKSVTSPLTSPTRV